MPLGDRTTAYILIYVPEGGIHDAFDAKLGILPDGWLREDWADEQGEILEVLGNGGTIRIQDDEANHGEVDGLEISEWVERLGLQSVVVVHQHGQGDNYDPCKYIYVPGEKPEVQYHPLWDGEPSATLSQLKTWRQEGASLDDVIRELTPYEVPYKVPDREVLLSV